MLRMGPPSDFDGARREHLPRELDAMWGDAPRSAVQNGERLMVLLYGPPGTGKTYAAAAFAHYLDERKFLYGWVSLFAGDDVPDDPFRVMFIDDIGREGKRVRPRLVHFLANALENGHVVIATTNQAVDPENKDLCALTRIYGEAMRSRLLGDSVIVEVNGKDRRLAT